jgi:hypothetical protein
MVRFSFPVFDIVFSALSLLPHDVTLSEYPPKMTATKPGAYACYPFQAQTGINLHTNDNGERIVFFCDNDLYI